MYILLSRALRNGMPTYRNTDKPRFLSHSAIERKDSCNVTRCSLTTHTGTHVDVPYHFLSQGQKLTDYTPDEWCFTSVGLCDVGGVRVIDRKINERLPNNPHTDMLLMRTGIETLYGTREYMFDSPIFAESLPLFLKKKYPRLKAVGLDAVSISSLKDREEGRACHRAFFRAGIRLIEDMALAHMYTLPERILVSPLMIDEADGAPVTVWAEYRDFRVRNYEWLFFDFDGVVCESFDIKTQAFEELYKRYGKSIVKKVVAHHVLNGGMSRYKKIAHYHKEFLGKPITAKEVDAEAERFSKIVFQKVVKAPLVKGALAFLKECREAGKPCFLISGTPEHELRAVIRAKQLEKYFVEIKGSPTGKEEHIEKIIRTYRVDRTQAVFFGDALNDVKAANYNGIGFVGINYKKAERCFRDFERLKD